MKMSLRMKLTSVFVILIALPLAVSGFTSYYNSSKALQAAVESELKATSASTAEIINNEMNSIKDYVSVASKNGVYAEVLSNEASGDSVKTKAYEELSSIYKDSAVKLESLTIVDNSGKGAISNEGISSSLNVADRDYFKSAISGKSAVSDVLTSKLTNEAVVSVCSPITQNNKVIGALVATVKFSEISMHASKIKIGDSGYSYMIDKSGMIISHPDTKKIMQENLSNTDSKELKALVEKMKKGDAGDGSYTYGGERKYAAFAPAGNWALVVTAPFKEYMKPANNIRNITLILTIAFVIVGIAAAYLFSTKAVINPIKKLEKLMTAVGHGDLSVRAHIKTGDELQVLGECFNEMLKEQEDIVYRVREGSDNLAAASEEMASSAQEISAASEEIASSIQEVSAGSQQQNSSVISASQVLVQLSSLVQLAQAKANSANVNADDTKAAAESGRKMVVETVEAMNIINSSTDETANGLKVINELSVKVRTIIDTINAIAEQTNLLALNAAIEAARAGEHGRGFTVVAEEVRKLSEQSNEGAKEISTLIGQMVSNIEKAVESMDHAINAVNNGVVVVNDTDIALVNIINAVDKIADDVKEIADLTKDEVATSDEIIKLIDNIGTISETNSANSENVASSAEEQTATVETLAATSEEISTMAEELERMVAKFKIGSEK